MAIGSSLQSMYDYLRGVQRESLMVLFSFSFIFAPLITSKLLNVLENFAKNFWEAKFMLVDKLKTP